MVENIGLFQLLINQDRYYPKMNRQFVVAACAIDWLLTLLFTQGGMFLIGKSHADAKHGLAPHELALGMTNGSLAGLALALAVAMLFHGLWCWRKSRALGAQDVLTPAAMLPILAAPAIAIVIAVTLGISMA